MRVPREQDLVAPSNEALEAYTVKKKECEEVVWIQGERGSLRSYWVHAAERNQPRLRASPLWSTWSGQGGSFISSWMVRIGSEDVGRENRRITQAS